MKKSRVLSVFLAVALLVTCCFGTQIITSVTAAGTEPTISITDVTGAPGEEVTVALNVENNPGIVSFYIEVNYGEGLSLVKVENTGMFHTPSHGGNLALNPYGLTYDMSLDPANNTSNGTVAYLTFKIDENATGEASVWVTYQPGNVFDFDMNDVDFASEAGTITIESGECEHSFTNYVSNGDATCEADGTKTAACDNGCGASDTVADEGSKVAHKYTTYVADNNATCEGNGTKTAECDFGCGATDTVEIADSELGHSYTQYESDGNATCTTDGTKTAECDNDCGSTDTVADPGSKIPHSFHNYTSNGDATCTADGTKTGTCEYGCGEEETVADVGSKIPHSYTSYVYNNDATYTADGTETASCDYACGATDTRVKAGSKVPDTTMPTGEIKVKENGWKSFINTITFGLFCKDKVDVTITAADNETGVKSIEYYASATVISEADIKNVTAWTAGSSLSVEEDGQYVVYAKITDNAGNVIYLSTDGIVVDGTAPVITGVENGKSYCATKTFAVADTNLDTVTVNGTVVTTYDLAATSAEGTVYTIVATDKAGNSVTVVVTVYDGHSYTDYVSNNDATCQADGTKTAACDNGCGATFTMSDVGSMLDHKYTNYVSNGDATCQADGTETAACDYSCGNTDTRTDADSMLAHKYTNYVSNGDATCEVDGTETASCDYDCGTTDTRTAVDSKLGHDWEVTATDAATCTEEGKEYSTCKNDASHTKEEAIPATGHTFGDWTVTKPATATEAGEKEHTCTVEDCGYTEKVEIPTIVIELIGLTDGAWETGKSTDLTFKANGDFGALAEVKVDGTVVAAENYTVNEDGSVTVKADFVNALAVGTHTIEVQYTDGSTSATFEVKLAPVDNDQNDDQNDDQNKDDDKDANNDIPETSDNSAMALWIALLVIASAGLVIAKKKGFQN